MKLTIANLIVLLDNPSLKTKERGKKYIIEENRSPDILIPHDDRPYPDYANTDELKLTVDYMREGFKFYSALIQNFNGTMLHSSAVVVNERAYLFSAPCGTGKSTHTSKWIELFGKDAYILNDDKPAIRIFDDGIYACGTPWSGKNDISENKIVKIQGICFLNRDKENWIKPIDKKESALRIYHGGFRRISSDLLSKQLEIINKIVEKVPVYEMGCTPTIEAAQMAYDAMSKGKVK